MAAARTEGEQWELQCRDFSGRTRTMRVSITAKCIVLTTPPGESAELDWQTAEELVRLLRLGATTMLGRPRQ